MNWLCFGSFVGLCAVALLGCPAGDGEGSCEALEGELAAEREAIVACQLDDDCGQPLTGTSCGCTRDLVARNDADPTRFYELLHEAQGSGCDAPGGSTCDCPEASGFVCNEGRCGWNYVDAPQCSPVPIGELCVRGTISGTEEILEEGDALRIQAIPSGCFSSGCTRVDVSTCSVELGDLAHSAQGEFCLASFGGDCDPDCGGAGFAECTSEGGLEPGEHTVTLGDLSVTFSVPGVLPLGGICDGSAF
jgi:hypothetical protein